MLKKVLINTENLKKKIAKFLFRFHDFFSIEVVYMKSRLRMQSFMIIGQGVPKIQGVTDKQTQVGDLLYRLNLANDKKM